MARPRIVYKTPPYKSVESDPDIALYDVKSPQQAKWQASGAFFNLLGGGLGCGKTYTFAAQSTRLMEVPQMRAIMLRDTMPNFFTGNSLHDTLAKFYEPLGAKWKDTKKLWKFPQGAEMHYGTEESLGDEKGGQRGAQYGECYIDELGIFTQEKIFALMRRVRQKEAFITPCGDLFKTRIYSTTNPTAQSWIVNLIRDYLLPTGYADPSRQYKCYIYIENILYMANTIVQLYNKIHNDTSHNNKHVTLEYVNKWYMSMSFVSTTIFDIPFYAKLNKPYIASLMSMPNPDVWLYGNYLGLEQSGALLTEDMFPRVDVSQLHFLRKIIVVDTASTVNTSSDNTAITVWGLATEGNWIVFLDSAVGKMQGVEIEQHVARLVCAHQGAMVFVETAGTGYNILDNLRARGVYVMDVSAQGKSKLARFHSVLTRIEQHYVRMPYYEIGKPELESKVRRLLTELINFRANLKHVPLSGEKCGHDDQVDTMVYAIQILHNIYKFTKTKMDI